MSQELHLELDTKTLVYSSFSNGELILDKAKGFTVFITEKKALEKKIIALEKILIATPNNTAALKEMSDSKTAIAKFATVNWAWNTVYGMKTKADNHNEFVAKGISGLGKEFFFPEVLEGGGYCYVEAFLEGEKPTGIIPNGLLIKATGKPKIIRMEWTDMQFNPIKNAKVSFGSHLLLHIYCQGLYGQEILIGLKDINGIDEDLNVANSPFFEREVKTYPVQGFEEQLPGVSSYLVKQENPKEAVATIQKAVIEVGIDFSWIFAGDELEIKSKVYDKHNSKKISTDDDDAVLFVSKNYGKKHDFTTEISNMPVVVGEIDTENIKNPKKPVNFIFGIFLDGTLNNMYDTEFAQKNNRTKNQEKIYKKYSDPDHSESSFENDLSNPAILFKNYLESEEKLDEEMTYTFAIYTEGIGTNSSPLKYGQPINDDDYKDNDFAQGPAFGMGSAGIMARVKKSIHDTFDKISEKIKDKDLYCVGKITFDVFGFSRGAAAARHFVHVVTHGPYIPKIYSGFSKLNYVWDLQGDWVKFDKFDKIMPKFGVLGMMLTDNDLMDDVLTQVNVRFVGIYDTVPHHGLFQDNDIKDLGLDNVNRAHYVAHMIAGDEYRTNFSLVDISTVNKILPTFTKKGGVEVIFPGVHCDVGGAYVEGGGNHPYRINIAQDRESLEKEKLEFAHQGWFQKKELDVHFYFSGIMLAGVIAGNYFRLEGNKKRVSNQYSYIPLHLMAEIGILKNAPIDFDGIKRGYDFKENWIENNVKFLTELSTKLRNYTFYGNKQLTFENSSKEITFLRYNYLHWNATYGDPNEAKGTWLSGKNKPNWDESGKIRKRYVR